MHIATKQPEQN